MNPPDLKKGQAYLILADYHGKDSDGDCVFIAESTERRLFLPFVGVQNCVFLPSEPPTLVGSTPKYDPCREFRKGDKVTPEPINKRYSGYEGRTFIVCQDEAETGNEIKLKEDGYIGHISINAAYLKLITPVEELEPYSLENDDLGWNVLDKEGGLVARFCNDGHPHAKEAAEAERDRLNAEYRKEQNNG